MELDDNAIDIYEHLPVMQKICMDIEAENILELGVRTGNSTRAFIEVADIIDSQVYGVDIEDCSWVSDSPRFHFTKCDSLEYVPDFIPSLVFIDTSHKYHQTLLELRRYVPLLPTAGVIMLHDTISCPEVLQAIQDFIKESDRIEKFENHTNNNGLGILWLKQA